MANLFAKNVNLFLLASSRRVMLAGLDRTSCVLAFFIFMSLCASYIIGTFVKTPLPFNVGVVFYSIAIMYIGFTARQFNKKVSVVFPILVSAVGIYITVTNPELMKFNMKCQRLTYIKIQEL